MVFARVLSITKGLQSERPKASGLDEFTEMLGSTPHRHTGHLGPEASTSDMGDLPIADHGSLSVFKSFPPNWRNETAEFLPIARILEYYEMK